ncbi:endonuclease/exonuclease/phosphatase family protein [Modestobacter sp. VKM Ac-2983]|uniref:endonuclease/exonuclease/phosphatase family protein n=1 Tax=Modestobacter sp. VKM Ac-2983 TaxID=3004137 RepID=UPI0022AB66D2|nr:endonuclease/exonuclease/phosphatase family protein [Modestobacter sp. VKM Ac-2983]MCZ2803715.1 endonuclease/exonuclease/phosphatase family protein [Modestobacter sp. VKM Ac-2983]
MLGALLGVAALLGLAAHSQPSGSNWLVAVSAFSTHLLSLGPLAVVLLVLAHLRVAALAAAVVTAFAVAVLAPTYAGGPAADDGPELTVLTANTRLGEADPEGIVSVVRSSSVDVLLLQELSPGLRDGLADAGLDQLLPHTVVEPLPGAAGIGLWSRYPLADEQGSRLTFPWVSARVLLGDGLPSPTVVAFHAAGPWPQPADDWVRDMAKLPGLLDEVAADAEPHGSTVLVGGDFNATWGNAQFRALLGDGYRDSAEQLGRQWTATFPSGYGVPPLIGIDHLLVRNAGARELDTVEIPGSDHLGLVVRVALPPG